MPSPPGERITGAAAPITTAFLCWSTLTLIRFVREQAQRRRIVRQFQSYVDPGLVNRLREIALLPDPAEFGGESYGDDDLGVLRAVAELLSIGMTPEIVLSMGRIYVDHFNALQHDVLDMLSGNTNPEWSRDELVEIQQSLTANAPRLLPAVDQLLSYVHHRTLHRLTLEAARDSRLEG